MAKRTQDREDLLRDGTAMPVRGKLLIDGVEVVIGFRRNGQLSLYWDQDPVFQFDTDSRLRRVFIDSNRLKSDNGRLVRLTKTDEHSNQPAGRLRLVTEPITAAAEARILQSLSHCLQQIDAALQSIDKLDGKTELQTVGASGRDFAGRVRRWIAKADQPIQLADGPSA